MRKTIGLLSILLAAQLMLAVGMSFTGPDLAAVRPNTPLIELGGSSVDRLTIEGPDSGRVVLARTGQGWVLPDIGDFPAAKAKVEGLLDRLGGLKRGLAVATTEAAQKRFRVSDQDFERRLSLAQGDATLATLYLGTSPGMRRVHARSGEDDAVYTVEFAAYDAPVEPEDWEDKAILQIPHQDIDKISLAELELSRTPGEETLAVSEAGDSNQSAQPVWSSAALAEGEAVNQANADALAQKLAELRIGSVLGRETQPGYGLDAPQLLLSVQRKGGEAVEYRLGKREQHSDYVLKVSSRPEYFRLPAYTADALIKAARREQLVAESSEAAGAGEAAQGQEHPAPSQGDVEPEQTTSEEGASQ